jgi:hypothetical protein
VFSCESSGDGKTPTAYMFLQICRPLTGEIIVGKFFGDKCKYFCFVWKSRMFMVVFEEKNISVCPQPVAMEQPGSGTRELERSSGNTRQGRLLVKG